MAGKIERSSKPVKKMPPTKNIGSQRTNPHKLHIFVKGIEFSGNWRRLEFYDVIVAPPSG